MTKEKRELAIIYDIFIYDIEIGYVIWNLINKLDADKKIKTSDDMSYIYIETYTFLQYYNNNYRPIYHLENLIIYIINIIHEFEVSN